MGQEAFFRVQQGNSGSRKKFFSRNPPKCAPYSPMPLCPGQLCAAASMSVAISEPP
jgi:hypothetical protein